MPTIRHYNKELSFTNIYYVDSTNGSNSNSGSKASPFQSVNYAITKCNKTGDAIFALAGIHDVTRIAGEYDSGGLWDDNKGIVFLGENEKTIFLCDGRKHKARDTHCIMFQNANSKAYNITFDFKIGIGRTSNYQVSICGGTGGAIKGEIINCLIKTDSTIPNFTYSNSGPSVTKFVNCSFDVKGNFVSSYSGVGFTIENCVSNFPFYSEGIRKNVFTVTYDEKYHVTNYDENLLNIGVHTGSYSWSYKWGASSILLKANNKIYSFNSNGDENLAKYVKSVTASGGLTPEKTIDGNTSSASSYGWSSTGLPNAWIKYEFFDAIVINQIDIFSYYHSGYEAIKDFTIEASNSGLFQGEEKTLYYGVHPNETSAAFIKYNFKNFKSYKFYRINIKSIYYGNGANNLSINEVQFWSNGIIELNVIQQPASKEIFEKFSMGRGLDFNKIINQKNYYIKNTNIDNSGFLINKILNNKPLSIRFD